MAFRVVGAVGIRVRPDTTKFHEELEGKLKAQKDVAVEIPVVPDKEISKTKLQNWASSASRTARENQIAVAIPTRLGSDSIMADVRKRVDIINERLDDNKSLYVRIRARLDDTGLAGSVTSVMQEARRQVREHGNVELPAALKLDTNKSQQEIDHFVREQDGKNINLDVGLDGTAAVRARLALLTRPRDVPLVVRIQKRSLAIAAGALAGLTGLGAFKEAARFVEDFAKNIDEYALAVGRLGLAWGNIVNLTGTGVGGLATVAGNIAQIGGAALALPAAAVSTAAFVLVSVAAFKNFKSAVDGSAEAMAALPVTAQGAARELRGVWTSIQIPVQAAFWADLGTSLQDMVHDVVGEFRSGLTEVGGAAGEFAKAAIEGVRSFADQNVYRDMFGQLSEGIRNASKGITPLVHAFVVIGDQGSRFLPEIGQWLSDGLQTFDRWVTSSAQSGKITEWMHNAAVQGGYLKDALKEAFGIFSGLADAAKGGGFGGLKTLDEKLGNIRDIVEGPGFQDTMATLFDGARDGAKELGEALGPIGEAIEDLAPDLSDVLRSVGSTVGGLVTSIAQAITSNNFKDGLRDLFAGLDEGVQGFSKYVQPIIDGLGSLGSVTGQVFSGTLPVIGQFFGVMGQTMTDLEEPLKNVADALNGSLSRGVTLIGQVAEAASGPVGAILDLFSRMPAALQDAVLSVAGIHKLMNGPSLKDAFKKNFSGDNNPFLGLGTAAKRAGQNAARAVRVSLLSEMNGISPSIRQAMDKDYFGNFFRGIESSVRQTVASAGQRLAIFRTAIGTSLVKAGRSFTDFLGGSWGVALLGATTFLSIYSDGVKQIQTRLDDAKQSAQALADIRLSNPLDQTGNKDANDAAYEQAQKLIDDAKKAGIDLSGRRQGIIDIILGKGDPETIAGLKQIEQFASMAGGNGFSRTMERFLSLGSNHDTQNWANFKTSLEGVLTSAPQVAGIMQDKLGTASETVAYNMQLASDWVKQFGVITTDNLPKVGHFLTANGATVKGVTTKYQDMAEIMAEAMGGSGKTVEKNAEVITKGLMHVGDSALDIARFMNDAGFSTRDIGKALQVLGYDSTQTSNAIDRRLVPSIAQVKSTYGELNKQITLGPAFGDLQLLTGASDGIKEISTQIGQAEKLDPARLEKMFRTFGTGAIGVVEGLQGMEVPADTIKQVLSDMGYDAYQAGSAIMFVADQTKAALGPNSVAPEAVLNFSLGLQQIASDASDARTQAQQLRDLLDTFSGGKLDSQRIASQFYSSVDAVKQTIEDKSIDWSKVFNKDGSLNLQLDQNRTLFGELDTLATDALTKAADAYDKTYLKTKDYSKAAEAAKDATGDLATGLETKLVSALGLPKAKVDALLTSFGLWPDQLVTNATVNARGATDPLVKILGMMREVAPGVTIPVGALTAGAVSKLTDLGIQVNDLGKGTYSITVDADSKKAKDEIDGLQDYVNKKNYTVDVTVVPDLGPLYNIPRRVGAFTGYFSPLADGGVLEKVLAFANGGVINSVKAFANGAENHVAHITRGLRVFGEPETGGEAYIPLAPAKRQRSLQILADVANRFGYMLLKNDSKLRRSYADGVSDTNSDFIAGSGNTFNFTNYYPRGESNAKAATRAANMITLTGFGH